MESPKLLIVDDEPDMAEFVSDVAEDMGFEPMVCFNAKECLDLAGKNKPSAVVMDVVMPNMDGVELVRELAKITTGIPIVIMSGYQPLYSNMVNSLACNSGLVILGTLTKPFTADQLEVLLKQVLESLH